MLVLDRKGPEQALKNIAAILEAVDSNINNVIKTTVYISDIELWNRVNAVYENFFGGHRPARAVVPTKNLPYGLQIEIEAVAALHES